MYACSTYCCRLLEFRSVTKITSPRRLFASNDVPLKATILVLWHLEYDRELMASELLIVSMQANFELMKFRNAIIFIIVSCRLPPDVIFTLMTNRNTWVIADGILKIYWWNFNVIFWKMCDLENSLWWHRHCHFRKPITHSRQISRYLKSCWYWWWYIFFFWSSWLWNLKLIVKFCSWRHREWK